MILRGGENISPYEIEDVLLAHPAVADAVCFGIEDAKYGEVVGAAVALGGEAQPSELADHCRERLGSSRSDRDPRPRRDPPHAHGQGAAQARRGRDLRE